METKTEATTEAMEAMIREWVGVHPRLMVTEARIRFQGVPTTQYEREIIVLLQRSGNSDSFSNLEERNGRPWWYTAVAVELLVRRGFAARRRFDSNKFEYEWLPEDDYMVHLIV